MWFFKKPASPTMDKAPEKDLLKKVRAIQIKSNRLATDIMTGEYKSAFKGRGMEFDTVREYTEGDDPRSVDWNVTARFGHPYVKSFVEERELTVIFVVDVSASGKFGSEAHTKKEVIAELCGVLAFNAMKQNDKVGLLLFSDQVELFIPAKKGKKHMLRIIRELICFQPQHVGTSIETALEYINKVIRKKAVLFLVSDFAASDYFKSMSLTHRRHDLVALEVVDPAEETPPKVGLLEIEDAETKERTLVDTESREWRHQHKLQRLRFDERKKREFRKHRIDHLKLYTDRPFEHQLSQFLKKRPSHS